MSASKRPITIADVAKRAEVSPATVSRVMNLRFVGEATIADRVRQAAADLDYRPNHLARGLALGKTGAIGFVVPDLANPAFQAVLSGLSKSAAKDGYRVLIADSAEDAPNEIELAMEIRRRCDAVVLCAPRMSHDELIALAPRLAPMVLVNRPDVAVEALALSIDYGTGIRDLALHLSGLGHTHIAYLAGPTRSASNSARVATLDRFEAETQGIEITRIPGGVTIEDGQAAAQAVIESGATGVLAFNDLVAVGLISELSAKGVRVPADVSVAGMDDIPYARVMQPALTTATVPHRALGVETWRRMHDLLGSHEPQGQVVFTPRLEVRASTGVPPR